MLMFFAASDSSSGGTAVVSIVALAIIVLVIAGLWTVFTKAGEAGWVDHPDLERHRDAQGRCNVPGPGRPRRFPPAARAATRLIGGVGHRCPVRSATPARTITWRTGGARTAVG